ncbi:MAG: hypothetical protein GX369_06215 [Euryarchaeota archaeon]|nr:hypothetical protein [Euryarchaeota archaeon]
MNDRWSPFALIILILGLILIVYALLTPVGVGGHSGMSGIRSAYESHNMVLAILGAVMVGASGAILIITGMRSGMPQQYFERDFKTADRLPSTNQSNNMTSDSPIYNGKRYPHQEVDGAGDDARLILRLLSGDERTVFRSLVDASGEQLQRDIVSGTKMSDAKVSRTLDRLEEKGLVIRERRGMGNIVRISIDRAN